MRPGPQREILSGVMKNDIGPLCQDQGQKLSKIRLAFACAHNRSMATSVLEKLLGCALTDRSSRARVQCNPRTPSLQALYATENANEFPCASLSVQLEDYKNVIQSFFVCCSALKKV